MTDVVIPVKDLSKVKGRLRSVLSGDERARFVLAMLHDLLAMLRQCDLGTIWLVAKDDAVLDLGMTFGARPIREARSEGYNHAVSVGLRAVGMQRPVLILPADLPLTTLPDIARCIALDTFNPPAVGIVPDRHKRGTNGLFLSAPDLIAPGFGRDSFLLHQCAARRAGVVPKVITLGSMAIDIDRAEDLASLARSGDPGAATSYLQSISFGLPYVNQQQWGVA